MDFEKSQFVGLPSYCHHLKYGEKSRKNEEFFLRLFLKIVRAYLGLNENIYKTQLPRVKYFGVTNWWHKNLVGNCFINICLSSSLLSSNNSFGKFFTLSSLVGKMSNKVGGQCNTISSSSSTIISSSNNNNNNNNNKGNLIEAVSWRSKVMKHVLV